MILINATNVVLDPAEAVRAIDELAWQARKTGQSWRTVAIVDALAQHIADFASGELEREQLQDKVANLEENLADAQFQIGKALKDLRGVAGYLADIDDKHAARSASSIEAICDRLKHLCSDST